MRSSESWVRLPQLAGSGPVRKAATQGAGVVKAIMQLDQTDMHGGQQSGLNAGLSAVQVCTGTVDGVCLCIVALQVIFEIVLSQEQ
jgi:hypothetical protein